MTKTCEGCRRAVYNGGECTACKNQLIVVQYCADWTRYKEKKVIE